VNRRLADTGDDTGELPNDATGALVSIDSRLYADDDADDSIESGVLAVVDDTSLLDLDVAELHVDAVLLE
jgi:hypothetical protein